MAERENRPAVAQRFGDNLRRLRKREDLSQERLGERASLHRTEIGVLENGKRLCRIDTLIKLACAMGVDPGELLEGIDWVPGPETYGTFSVSSGPIRARRRPATEETSE